MLPTAQVASREAWVDGSIFDTNDHKAELGTVAFEDG
jgi:hypothetical protein